MYFKRIVTQWCTIKAISGIFPPNWRFQKPKSGNHGSAKYVKSNLPVRELPCAKCQRNFLRNLVPKIQIRRMLKQQSSGVRWFQRRRCRTRQTAGRRIFITHRKANKMFIQPGCCWLMNNARNGRARCLLATATSMILTNGSYRQQKSELTQLHVPVKVQENSRKQQPAW